MSDALKQSCRFCGTELKQTMVDLGMQPLCESFVEAGRANEMEPFFPLHVKVCGECFLVQLDEYVSVEEIFSEYAYFSSFSDSWLQHAARYTEQVVDRFGLDSDSFVVELASNDGYLLRNFVERNIPNLGIDPAANVAAEAEKVGVETLVDFFGAECAARVVSDRGQADLIAGNNVLAQVPALNDFVEGISILLKPDGVLTLEFPHLKRLLDECQYDTIYHEHFCYFSLLSVEKILSAHGLKVFDVDELPSHGGSLRIYACRETSDRFPVSGNVSELRSKEDQAGFQSLETYAGFGEKVKASKRALLKFLIEAKEQGQRIAGYGAPGKGNTLLNYCGIGPDFLELTVDRNPYKHGRLLPGSHIPIYPVEKIDEIRPDILLILPWNLSTEIVKQMKHVQAWGCTFAVPIPEAKVIGPE